MSHTLNTCRHCQAMIWHGQGIKRGSRHWICYKCQLDRHGLAGLSRAQLECLPYGPVKDRGLWRELEKLLAPEPQK